MTGTRPPDPGTLVAALARDDTRFPTYQALIAHGVPALPAIREGLRHEDWQVRKWSAMCLDQVADPMARQGRAASRALGPARARRPRRADDPASLEGRDG